MTARSSLATAGTAGTAQRSRGKECSSSKPDNCALLRMNAIRTTELHRYQMQRSLRYTGSLGHEDTDAKSFVEWGFDFVKVNDF